MVPRGLKSLILVYVFLAMHDYYVLCYFFNNFNIVVEFNFVVFLVLIILTVSLLAKQNNSLLKTKGPKTVCKRAQGLLFDVHST